MIDSPPEYSLSCCCGVKITGTNENGLISLMKKHIESGRYHLAYLMVSNQKPGEQQIETVIEKIPPIVKAKR